MASGPRGPDPGQQTQQFQSQQAGGAAGQREPLFRTRNYLSEDVRRSSIAALNKCLADTLVLHSQLKSAHWNVKGRNFFQLHELFDELAAVLDDHADALAERATALGGYAHGTVSDASEASTIPELSPGLSEEGAVLEEIADNLSRFDRELFQQMEVVSERGDLDTVDLLNEVSRDVSESLWFVEAHLQGQSTAGAQYSQQIQTGPGQQQMLQQ